MIPLSIMHELHAYPSVRAPHRYCKFVLLIYIAHFKMYNQSDWERRRGGGKG